MESKDNVSECIYKTEIELQIQNKLVATERERRGETNYGHGINILVNRK